MNTIYYYYYLFYKKVIKDDEPYATTIWALSASEGFCISAILNVLLIKYFCYQMEKWMMFFPILIFLLCNYLYFNKSGRSRQIVKMQPTFFSNHRLSIYIAILFFIITFSSLFWGAFYTKYLLKTYCR